MLKCYRPRTEVFINKIHPFLIKLYKNEISETIPDTKSIKADWNNILDVYEKIGLYLPYGLGKTKRGLKFYYHDYFSIKQWKEDLDIEIKTSWIEYKPTINELLNFYDSDKAIQYLVERGLNIISLMKELQ